MKRKKFKLLLSTLSLVVFLWGCSEDAEFTPIKTGPFTLVSHELNGITINELLIKNDWIFAATSDGVYGKNLKSTNSKFISLGLKGNNVLDLHPFTDSEILSSVVNLKENEGLVSKLYKTNDRGNTWSVFESNFGGSDPRFRDGLSDFEEVPGHPNHLYATGQSVIAKSLDRGKTWQPIWGEWGMVAQPSMNMALNPVLPNELWVGGQGPIENGYLVHLKNDREEKSWNDLVPNPTVVKEIVIDRDNPQTIYVGWEGELSKTTDNGKTWKTLIDRHAESHFFFGIGISPGNSNIIYAAKWKKAMERQILEIYHSKDKGLTWETTAFPQIAQGGVWDLRVIRSGNQDRLYLGLDKGGIAEVIVDNL
ncbi:MAG: hypothetical protein C0433_04240 [Cyclobacterium sp.]|nr:hypothetical protein [Cyclobacterium sp.]